MSELMNMAAFEEHPLGKALCDRRHRAACDFKDPQHQGQRGEDWDNGFLAACEVVRAILTPMTDTVQVTQADRDAAADLHIAQGGLPRGADRLRSGELDDDPAIEAFARHRTRVEPDLVEALRKCADKLEEERDDLLHSVCIVRDGAPDRSTISAKDAEWVTPFDDLIAEARAALTRADG